MLHISYKEFQELNNEAYENSMIYKAKMKAFHDKLSRLKPYIEVDPLTLPSSIDL